jgi:uncharacterized protein
MSERIESIDLPRKGRLYSFTTMHVGAARWHKPIQVGYVDLPNNVRIFTHLRGESFDFDQELELAEAEIGCESDGTPVTSFVFQPIGSTTHA